jgi:hypothetical protein
MQNNTHKWNGKRKRSVSHTTVKPATPITAFFKPVSLTIKVFIPFTVPTLNHLNHPFNPTTLTTLHHPMAIPTSPQPPQPPCPPKTLLPERFSFTNDEQRTYI